MLQARNLQGGIAMAAQCVLLTGGIASGKSTVSQYFLDQYAIQTVDTDQVAKKLTTPHTPNALMLLKQLRSHFPDAINEALILNRTLLRQKIFHDKTAKSLLESIMHPLIYQECISQIKAINASYCFVAIPLLHAQSPYLQLSTQIITVETAIDLQIERLCLRDAISRDLAQKIIQSQPSKASRLALANYVIDCTVEYSEVYKQCDDIIHKIQKVIDSSPNNPLLI